MWVHKKYTSRNNNGTGRNSWNNRAEEDLNYTPVSSIIVSDLSNIGMNYLEKGTIGKEPTLIY